MASTYVSQSVRDVVASALTMVLSAALAAWSVWVAIVAFTGGQALLVSYEGFDFTRGLIVLFVGIPVVGAALYLIGVLLVTALAVIVGGIAGIATRFMSVLRPRQLARV